MRGFDHETILSRSFHGVRKERLAQWPPIFDPKTTKKSVGDFQKNCVGMCGTLPETLTLFQTKICDFPYPISDLIKNLIPYFRPEALEPGAWPERVTSCYGTYTVSLRTYPYRLYKGLPPSPSPPPWRKTLCRLWVSLLTQARLKNL